MTHPEILASSRVLLTAGSETTATLLSGTTYFLLTNPSWLARVQAEIREAFHTSEEITLRSVSQPGLLPLLEAVLQESLRCYPPLPGTLPRVTGSKGAIIDSKFVPQGVSSFIFHRLLGNQCMPINQNEDFGRCPPMVYIPQ